MKSGSQLSRFRSPFWIFNGLMLWGAAVGFLILIASGGLLDTIRHKGPGVVHHGDGEHGPEWSEEVSESEYKQENYLKNVMMLALGLCLWYCVAKFARMEATKAKANAEYLESRIRTATSYHRAFASAINADTREHAAGEALLSKEFQDAQKDEELAWLTYSAAAKAAKGDG